MGRRRSSGPIRLGPLLLLALCACDVSEQAGRDIEDGTRLTREQLDAQRAAQRGEVLRVDRPYYGGALKVTRGSRQGDPLPRQLEAARGVSLRLPGQADIRTIAAAITSASGLPVNIRTRYILTGGDVVEVPIGSRMRIDYEGPLSRLLDQVAARMDVAWTHEKGSLTIDRMVSKTYRVPLPTTRGSFTSEIGGAGGTETGSTKLKLETTQTTDQWAELERRLAPLTPRPARLTLLAGSGRVEVFGPPSVHHKVRAVMDDLEETFGQRVGLEIGVYFLDSAAAENFGLSTTGFRIGRTIARSGSAIILGGADRGGAVSLRGQDGSSIDLQALAEDRSVLDFRIASTIGQSGVVSPLAVTRSATYVKSRTIETVNTDNGGVPGQKVTISPGEVEFGISIHALPRILDARRIQLFLNVLQSDLVGDDVAEIGGENTIGAPVIDKRIIQNQSILETGEVLVLSGYERNVAASGKRGIGLFKAIGLGGNVNARSRKIRMVILVRPSIIPQRGR
ncbi:secretion protein [Ruegeria sp.]|uniref:secretion protein n=1 Tax=Ruegeria sp. TaxID=1879320 RepID=UPI003B00157B